MAIQKFESEEDITRHYDRQIKDADDDLAVANLRAERAERLSEFRAEVARESQRQAWVAQAIAENGLDPSLSDLLSGRTQDDIKAQAAKLSGLSKAPEPTPASAEDTYGSSTVGGGTPVRQSKDATGEWLSDFERRFNNGDQLSPSETQRYVRERLGRHTYAAMQEFGKPNHWKNNPTLTDRPEYERT